MQKHKNIPSIPGPCVLGGGGSRMMVKWQTTILGQCLWFCTWSVVVWIYIYLWNYFESVIEKFRLAKWQNGKMGKLFQTKEHGANIKPKEMLNYLEGGSEGSLSNDYKIQSEIQANTNEDLKFTFIIYNLFIFIIYNL